MSKLISQTPENTEEIINKHIDEHQAIVKKFKYLSNLFEHGDQNTVFGALPCALCILHDHYCGIDVEFANAFKKLFE
jgi:hypothetical protein